MPKLATRYGEWLREEVEPARGRHGAAGPRFYGVVAGCVALTGAPLIVAWSTLEHRIPGTGSNYVPDRVRQHAAQPLAPALAVLVAIAIGAGLVLVTSIACWRRRS